VRWGWGWLTSRVAGGAGDVYASAVSDRVEGLIIRDVGTETIVYDPRTHRAHCLGRTAAAVWRMWDSRSETREIAHRVSQALGEPLDETSVRFVLRRLGRAGLVDTHERGSDGAGEKQGRLGRRAALRRVGVASLAVLSIAVRSPAQAAATCLPNGRQCLRSSECCSSCCNSDPGRCTGGGNCVIP